MWWWDGLRLQRVAQCVDSLNESKSVARPEGLEPSTPGLEGPSSSKTRKRSVISGGYRRCIACFRVWPRISRVPVDFTLSGPAAQANERLSRVNLPSAVVHW